MRGVGVLPPAATLPVPGHCSSGWQRTLPAALTPTRLEWALLSMGLSLGIFKIVC